MQAQEINESPGIGTEKRCLQAKKKNVQFIKKHKRDDQKITPGFESNC